MWTVGTWARATITVEFEPYSGISNIKIYKNGMFSWYVMSEIFIDFAPSYVVLGADLNGNSGFTGFLYGLKVYTYALPQVPIQGNTLDLCSALSFRSNTGCQNCPNSCSTGCVRSSDCNLCNDRLCAICRDFTAYPCLHCIAHASVSSNFCVCDPGFYLSFSGFGVPACLPCSPRCGLCDSPGDSGCSLCAAGEYLSGPPPSPCICSYGHYIDMPSGRCLPCSGLCETCDQTGGCITCKANSSMFSSGCRCDEGYYGSKEGCLACKSPCLACTQSECTLCANGYSLVAGMCLMPDFYCSLDISSIKNRLLRLNFTSTVAASLQESDIKLEATAGNNTTPLLCVWTFDVPTSNRLVPIKLLHLPYDDSNSYHGTLIVTFIEPSSIHNTEGGVLQTKVMETPLDWEAAVTSPSTGTSQVQAAVQAAGSVVLVAGLVTGRLGSLWGFINTFELLAYLPLANFPITDLLRNVLLGLNLLDIFPNPFDYIEDPAVSEAQNSAYIQENGPTTSLFLPNISQFLIPIIGGVLYSLCLFWASQLPSYRHFITKLWLGIRWNGVLRLLIQAYMTATYAGLLQAKSPSLLLVSAYGCLNVLLGILGAGLMGAAVVWLPWFLWKHKVEIKKEEVAFKELYWTLIGEFDIQKGWAAIGTYVPFFTRRLLYALVLAFTFDFPYLQAGLIASSACLLCFHFSLYRPYVSFYAQVSAGVQEFTTCSVMLVCCAFVLPLGPKAATYLSTLGVGLVIGGVGLSAVVGVAEACASLWKVWQEFREKRVSRIRPKCVL